MARVQSPPGLAQIQAAGTYSEQAVALRTLRDEIIGHVQRKEEYVQHGILDVLVEILQNSTRSPKRSSGKEPSQAGQPTALSEDDVVRLLALQLLASFANGGSAFLAPLHAAGVVPAIIPAISPNDNPSQVVLAALRMLSSMTASARLAQDADKTTSHLADVLFSTRSLEALCAILSQDSPDFGIQEQKRLVAGLISRLCKTTKDQNALAESGVLDALATILASFAVARGEVIPGAEVLGRADGLVDFIPRPAPPGADLASVLDALSTIVVHSRFRSYLLLQSPSILAVFPWAEFTAPAPETRAAWIALETHGLRPIRPRGPGAMDFLLPAIPILPPKARLGDFPPLGASPSREAFAANSNLSSFRFTGVEQSRGEVDDEEDSEEPESPLIPWLIHLVRTTDDLERVMAASLVASLFKAGFASPDREQYLAMLVIPVLYRLLSENDKEVPTPIQRAATVDSETTLRWTIMERTPEVLARLVGESGTLQKAASECGVIKLVAKLLKDSYAPHPVQLPPKLWSANPDRSNGETKELPPSRQLGLPGRVPAYAHKIQMRESALKLVAAMATLNHGHRDALIEADVAAYVVESLAPCPGKPKSSKDKSASEKGTGTDKDQPPYGLNPKTVIIAACHATRTLARGPSIVRTTLQDHGFAMPVYQLLKHPDPDVQIAASSAVINLVSNLSPMVKTLLDAGIMQTLCEHAHSLNPGLRLNALWALKHLVADLGNDLRKKCLEELEPGWLVQLISDDRSEEESRARARAEHRRTDADDDEDMESEGAYDGDSDWQRDWTWPGLNIGGPGRAVSPRLQQVSAKLTTLRDAEVNPTRRARNDSLAIQEQGLGFIRNLLLLPSNGELPDMVDHLFTEVGQDRLFAILADKLKVRVVNAFGRRATTSGSTRGRDVNNSNNNNTTLVLYPQARIVENLTYILVHIAASMPRHRQLVVAQTDLLKLLGAHLGSKDPGVRRALCQLFTNLTWLEDDGDKQPCAQRASELKRLGFLAKLEGMEQGDADLGVRERARAAIDQMKKPTLKDAQW
ncbi:hypothetical protein VTJ49DRAFT_155 [Mycothermus thermophilus]|uniref:Armadillo repeat-containing protein 8 n=1 Tax=Humicola insolens TaxID=85995 RepID=A0ABR3VGH1_HUMIN